VPPPSWRDWALAGVLAALAVLEAALRPDLPWRALSVILTVALVPTLVWRRTRPLLMVAIAFGVLSVVPLLTRCGCPDTNTMAYALLLPYSLFRWGSGREAVIGLVVIVAKLGLWAVFDSPGASDVVAGFAVVFSVAALGGAFRYRAGARMRAHHVSAMAIRAQAGLAVSASQPGAAADALHVIEAEASRALAEMRAMVRVLRRDQQADRQADDQADEQAGLAVDLAPGRRVADLEGLASRAGGSAPRVEVEIRGDVDGLAPPVGAAIYRIAQESITNARRHARHATRVDVRVTADDTAVSLRVSDDGDTSPVRPPGRPGYGLIGMTERAQLLGGTCHAGPAPGGGWVVTAVLPRTGAAT
jgi:signal transduction histidine kinase